MATVIEISVPDIGDFKDVEVIEVLVKPGDVIKREDSLIALESDKATMEIPSPSAGVVKELKTKVGAKVSEGSVILLIEASTDAAQAPVTAKAAAAITQGAAPVSASPAQRAPAAASPESGARADITTEVVVLGAGPGGYTAAFRAADLGKQVTLIERYPTLGGVCLNVGCIPSKALLHVAKVIGDARDMAQHGIEFGAPKIDIAKMQTWKSSVVGKLTKGLSGLAKQRKVNVLQGVAKFIAPKQIEVATAEGKKIVAFDHAVIAAGSVPAKIPDLPDDPRVLDSTSVLALPNVPKRMLIIGGGIIGLEMATVWDALGAKITVVELMDALIPGCDPDLVKPLAKRIGKRYERILLGTKVTKLEALPEGVRAHLEGKDAPASDMFDAVLVAVGRRANGKLIGAEAAGIKVNERGYIPVDKQQRSNVAHIFAIGDIVGEPMLAHKATHEGKVAAEVIAGHNVAFEAATIPNVAYTDPEIAWMGLSEPGAKEQGAEVEVATFPWAASGRALGTARDEGLTKLVFDKTTRRLLGAGIVGPNAGELIAETVLALEMGADAEDIGLSIHPHPTLSETIAFAAEIAQGSITDLYMPKKR